MKTDFSRANPELEHPYSCRCLAWSGIIAAAIVAVGLGFIFNLLNLGLGLTSYTTSSTGVVSLAIGGFIWLIISAIISMFIPGYISGRLASHYNYRDHARSLGLLHGFITWCLALILMGTFAAHLSLITLSGSRELGTNFQEMTNNTAMSYPSNQLSNQSSTTGADQNTQTKSNVTTQMGPDQKATAIGTATLATFIIFLIGAISCCLGGMFGITSRYHDGEV